MNGREVDLNFDVGVILSVCYPDAGLPDVTIFYHRSLEGMKNLRLVADTSGFKMDKKPVVCSYLKLSF